MSYNRVIPRDLFNEAKLLECLGQLVLQNLVGLEVGEPEEGEGFQIELDNMSNVLFCANVDFLYKGEPLVLGIHYNAKDPYPLTFNDVERVFNDDGTLSPEFKEYLAS